MKLLLRKEALARRNAIPEADREHKEKIIFAHLKSLPLGDHVFVYKNMRSEVSTERLMEWMAKKDITIYLPRTDFDDHSMVPVRCAPGDPLEEKAFGLLEPAAGEVLEDLSKLTAVIVPMVAFNASLQRLGYGGGFYDRFLPKVPQALRIGAAFSEQETDGFVGEETDIPLDFIVTDEGILIGAQRAIPRLSPEGSE